MEMLLAWMLLGTSALAQDFVPAPGLAALSIDLDTEEGHYAEWRTGDLCSVNALRASVTVPRLGVHERWAPAVNFFVARGQERVGVQFSAPERVRPFIADFVHYGATAQERTPLQGAFAFETPVQVELTWTPEGVVTINVGDDTAVLSLGGAPDAVAISNSTGEAIISPFQLGRVGPSLQCSPGD
jgi:hypothetical protein